MATGLEQTLNKEQETMGVEGALSLSSLLSNIPDSLQSGNTTTDEDENNTPQGTDNEPPQKEVVEVVRTAEELELEAEAERVKKEKEAEKTNEPSNQQGNEEGSFISQAREFLGLEDDDEDEDETVEGILNVAKKAVDKAVENAKKAGPTELYEKLPVVKTLVDHLEAGGSILSFQRQQQVQDFSKFEIKEDDTETQEQMYRTYLQAKGMDEDEVEDTITTAKDKGVLHERSLKGKEFLVKNQATLVQQQIDKEKADKQAEIDADIKAEQEVKKILASGKLLGMAITKEEATDLEKWGLQRDEKGLTQREKDWAALTTEEMLVLDKIIRNKFKGLGIKVRPATSTPLSELKQKPVKTVNMQTSNQSSIGSTLGITNAKDLFGGH